MNINDAWNEDHCPSCGERVCWDEVTTGAHEGEYEGYCEGDSCAARFSANVAITLTSIIRTDKPEPVKIPKFRATMRPEWLR